MGGPGRTYCLALLVVFASYSCFEGTCVVSKPQGKEETSPLFAENQVATGIYARRIQKAIQLLRLHHGSHVPPRFLNMESSGWCCPCQPSGAKNGIGAFAAVVGFITPK